MNGKPCGRVASPPGRLPLLLYDGACGFCRLWIARWEEMTRGQLDYAPYQVDASRFPEISLQQFQRSVVLIGTDGSVSTGAEAVFRALACAPGRGWIAWFYHHVPGASLLAESAYRVVAAHRPTFSLLTRLFWGTDVTRPTYFLSRSLFLRLIGIVYLAAFLSLWVQVHGLVGSHGILPVASYLQAAREQLGGERYWLIPTLCWMSDSDAFLSLLCAGGAALSCLVILGGTSPPLLFPLWVIYLSLTAAGQTFLRFQWDNLLLEAGLLAILLAPPRLRCAIACPSSPPHLGVLLIHWLVFRLMFSSGVVKLASGDRSWLDLTALTVYYETQPLPTWTAWYAHQLPLWSQQASTLILFWIELVAPFCVFAPRRLRHVGLGALIVLQCLIAATGNYGFFNFLSVVLCVMLLDDQSWPSRWKDKLSAARSAGSGTRPGRGRGWILLPLGIPILILGAMQLADGFRTRISWPAPIGQLAEWASPLRSVNGYGLFAVMTTSRPEIIIEGSEDGQVWRPYEFRRKPGDPRRPPSFVGLHMPRLDWQMWFAALGSYQTNPWFARLLARLLEGSPDVLALLRTNPFPGVPPRYVRAVLYDYRFTDLATRRREGTWWRREPKGLYCPVFSRREGR